MTKKLTTLTNDSPLDLSNPEVAKLVVEAEISNQTITPSHPEPLPKSKRGKQTSFTIQLETEEVASLIRQAEASNTSWKTYLEQRIRESILEAKVGRAVITNPSTMKAKITGVTGSVTRG